ncbi:hypothetical protein NC797_08300 [Aquibacillus sp. 3ASR75-11]|uniref:Uncharacterized protein n=1 Tax=Terrihalobacillus insolitus TaxID=2950438 RepID=A0A9X4ANG5_9BACI|nr:hypothetical protein [Terrihalobacillus insolitus]MDC3413843.1 hypothetical protein [Terrihalobacillus insolitus]MDC3424510.1 hypothetical protein [Terrihalobacillus insolitus]
MGLFINKSNHPNIFKNNSTIKEPNQESFRRNYFSEMVEEQKKINDSLIDSFHDLKHLYQQQETNQVNNWNKLGQQLNELKEKNIQQDQFESEATEWLTKLDENNRKLRNIVENESVLNKDMYDQINALSQSNKEIVDQLGSYDTTNQQLLSQMQHIQEHMSKQDDKQSEMMSRVESQEALMEKALIKIDHIRSTLYERANYLAEEIENGYNITSTFLYQLVTSSDQPLNLYMMKQKKEENQKES